MGDPKSDAAELAELFPEVYLFFHTRGRKEERWLTPEMWGVLQHLEFAGPLTVTELAHHVSRAQSVVTEIVDGLERRGAITRVRDARDRRRTLVWLTEAGQEAMRRERQVLDPALLERALTPLGDEDRRGLLRGIRALVASAGRVERKDTDHE